MREIVREYGRTFIAFVSAIFALAFIFGKSTFNNTLKATFKEGSNPTFVSKELKETRPDFKSQNKRPDIESATDLKVKELYSLEDLFVIKNLKEIRLISVEDTEGNDIRADIIDADNIVFNDEGIYRFKIWLDTSDGTFGTESIYLAVRGEDSV